MRTVTNWIVLSPGRTGSKVIVDSIRQGRDLTYVQPNEIEHLTELLDKHIYQSHSTPIFRLRNENTLVIISIRDIVESALSWCIVPHIGYYHSYPLAKSRMSSINPNEQLREYKIQPFHLDPKTFEDCYNKCVMFYSELSAYDLRKCLVIDYDEFADDSIKVVEILKDVMSMQQTVIKPGYTTSIKNLGDHKDWITNWNEIQTLSPNKIRSPLQYLGSSIGRAAVSKTAGWGFEALPGCTK